MDEQGGQKKKFRLNRTVIMILLALAAMGALALAVLMSLDARHVRFYLVDSAELTVSCGGEFTDPGCYAVAAGKLFGEGQKRLPVTVQGTVDAGSLGDYTLTYKTRYHFHTYSTSRLVHVVDTTPPVITLNHIEGYAPSWFTGYQEEGYTALDDCDGDVTAKVQVTDLGDRIEYTVSDAAGNTATVERHPEYTVTRPSISLTGGEELTVNASLAFQDPGYAAADTLGNDLTGYVQVEGEVVPYRTGDYTLTYSITNDLGETVSAQRQVTVLPVRNPDTVTPDGNTIYLTFDDGPGPYTDGLLDLLAKYNVKATFFVTCLNPKYADCIGRAYREGHSIGVHSATHNYRAIYASEDAFFEDFNKAQQLIYEQTGSYTTLFRFPGGSSNTVSSFNPGIMSTLAREMTDMGYKYFDWNVSSGDAGETTKTSQVVENIIDGCSGRRASVVLQHDIKDYSVAAVEKVILWALNNGYTFRPLDETSPGAHHAIAN